VTPSGIKSATFRLVVQCLSPPHKASNGQIKRTHKEELHTWHRL